MSEPLIPERTGDLAELGLDPHPTTSFDEAAAMEEEAQAATAAESTIPDPEPAQVPEDQAAPEGAQPVEEVQEESILQALQQEQVPEESESTRLRQENQRLYDMLQKQTEIQEQAIRNMTAPPETPAEPEQPGSLMDSEPVKQVLARLADEDPAQYQAALTKVIEQDLTNKFQGKFDAFEQEREQAKVQHWQQQQAAQAAQYVQNVFADVKSKGGLEAELIQQLETDPKGSYIGKQIDANPGILASEYGIRGVVQETAAQLRAQYQAQQQSMAGQVTPSSEASAGGGTASRAGVQLGEKTPEKSPEDQIADEIMGAGGRTDALDFFGL